MRALRDRLDDVEPAAGFQRARRLGKRRALVLDRHVMQRVEEHRDVEHGVGQGQGLAETAQVVLVAGRLGGARPAELALGGVDAGRARAQARHQAHQRPVAAADIGDPGALELERFLHDLAVRTARQFIQGR